MNSQGYVPILSGEEKLKLNIKYLFVRDVYSLSN